MNSWFEKLFKPKEKNATGVKSDDEIMGTSQKTGA